MARRPEPGTLPFTILNLLRFCSSTPNSPISPSDRSSLHPTCTTRHGPAGVGAKCQSMSTRATGWSMPTQRPLGGPRPRARVGRVARIVARAAGGAAPASSPRGGGGVGDERGRRDAGPSDPAPSYAAIDGNPVNALFFRVFRNKLEERVGFRSDVEVRSRHTHTHTKKPSKR